jgi:hypothetical protein
LLAAAAVAPERLRAGTPTGAKAAAEATTAERARVLSMIDGVSRASVTAVMRYVR